MAFRNLPEMPCGPILELHGQRKRFHVPYGLKLLLEDMTREVLRYQPENIYEFLAGFMDSRLQKKLAKEAQQQKRKSWQQHRWSWQGASILEPDELKEFLEQLPAPVEEVSHHATVIQAAFRGYQARKKVKNIRKSEEIRRKSIKFLNKDEEEEEEEEEDEDEYDEEGFRRRKSKRATLDLTAENATTEEIHATVVLQAAFRGMQTRKEIKKLRASMHEHRQSILDEMATLQQAAGKVADAGEESEGEEEEEMTPADDSQYQETSGEPQTDAAADAPQGDDKTEAKEGENKEEAKEGEQQKPE